MKRAKKTMDPVEACREIVRIIFAVEDRCMTHDTVTPTSEEITEEELRAIYRTASAGTHGQ